ncbi:S41 family peptidase [Actinosynnema sp. NPDC047251]|uniref:Peptidase S41 n=1 Tax=Saccharothrix espanaensis (strain ATCC 51144 / DSM 44229 / JCM 9112 / NBRC 15066 / NRRL 15764) TaxID=1179773 RepID=K0JZJ6_SACES|nr:S41 family peptidase [Saccharothrix espanaensis]CCH30707.1 Peptidase S41 [Saccharothrix espanaensis DSM 44229]
MDTPKIVDRTRGLLREYYVFPDVATELDGVLAARATAYAAATDPRELAELVTADLQSVNGDRHLRLKHHEEEIPEGDDAAVEQVDARLFAESMGGVPRVERLPGGVAVLELAPLLSRVEWAGEVLAAAFTLVSRAEALILDLRENRGGDPHTVALVCSYLLAEPTHLNTMYSRDDDSYQQFWSLPYVSGRAFGAQKPVYVLTSGKTFSGAEELAYDLQQLGRATIVGERTGGGAHPRRGFTVHPHLEATIPTARAINPVSNTNWELVGVTPTIATPAAEALATAYREALAELVRRGGPTAAEAGRALAAGTS